MWLWLVVAVAFADEPAPSRADAPVVVQGHGEGTPVIVVQADAVARAREAVIQGLGEQGYTREKRKGDVTILRSDAPWKGRIYVYDDGWVRMKVPTTLATTKLAYGLGVAGGFELFPSKGKVMGVEENALDPTQSVVQAYGDSIADLAVQTKINALPARLSKLWEEGIPLDGGGELGSKEARKSALLAYWESRTDTVWGDRVRAAIEAFVNAEVQTSEDAFTDAEIDAFNERRHCERDLDLRRDWSPILGG